MFWHDPRSNVSEIGSSLYVDAFDCLTEYYDCYVFITGEGTYCVCYKPLRFETPS